jgi:hypothetical protein
LTNEFVSEEEFKQLLLAWFGNLASLARAALFYLGGIFEPCQLSARLEGSGVVAEHMARGLERQPALPLAVTGLQIS